MSCQPASSSTPSILNGAVSRCSAGGAAGALLAEPLGAAGAGGVASGWARAGCAIATAMATHTIFAGRGAARRGVSNLRHGGSSRLLAGDPTAAMDARVSRTDDAIGKAWRGKQAATAR